MKDILRSMRGMDKFNLSKSQKEILNSIEYTAKDKRLLTIKVRQYLKEGYPIDVLRDNWSKIRELGKDSSSKESFILRYGVELGTKMYSEKTAACINDRAKFIEKYGEGKADEILSSRGQSLENYIKRWGENEGKQRWENYCKRRKNSYTKGREEQKYASRDLAWFQEKYGEDEGFSVWDAKRKSQAHKVSLAGYIEKYGEEEGTLRCKEAKSRGEEYWIKKYGQVEGRQKFIEHCSKITAAKTTSVSKWSIECSERIKEIVQDLKFYGLDEMIIGLSKSDEEKIGQKIIRPDIFYHGKIIEFQGDLFHGNPDLFEATDTPHPYNKLTQSELRAIDGMKIAYYNSKGWEVLEIWENDYNLNKEEVIDQCIQFLTTKTK